MLDTAAAAMARVAIAIACTVAIATPSSVAWSAPSSATVRPYEGPREIEAGAEPPPAPEPPLLLDEGDDEPAGDDDDDDEPDDGVIDAEPFDWRDTPEGENASRKIRGGVILTAGGALLVIGAAILGTMDPCRRLAGNGCQREARTRAALTMGLPGALAVAAGATLLGLGVAQRKRARTSVLVDVVGRHGAGVSIAGRF